MWDAARRDLRVIRRQQNAAGRRDESRANLPPLLAADGYVLEVRVAAGEPACRRACLVEARVNAPGAVVDARGQRLQVRADELRQLAVVQHQAG